MAERMETIEDLLWSFIGKKEKVPVALSEYGINRKIGKIAASDVLSVVELMEQGVDYNTACGKVAINRDIAVQTVYDACTRRLGISTEDFKEIVSDYKKRDELKKLLSKNL